MTALPDPAELAPSRDPAAYGRRRVMSPSFWAMISLCVLCILAGMAIVSFGPRVFHVRPSALAVGPETAIPAASEGYTEPAPNVAAASAAGVQPAQIGALTDRVTRLESAQARTLDAAAGGPAQ